MFLKSEFSNRLVQVSLFSAIVYYITAYPIVFEKARKYFPIKFKKTHHLLIFHTFVFAVLMYLLTYFVFDPIVRVVEGAQGQKTQGPGAQVQSTQGQGAQVNDGSLGSLGSSCVENQICNEGLVCNQDNRCAKQTTPSGNTEGSNTGN
jgi:hypothetical protein